MMKQESPDAENHNTIEEQQEINTADEPKLTELKFQPIDARAYRQDLHEFKHHLALFLFLTRCQTGLLLTDIVAKYGWDLRRLERIEIGRMTLKDLPLVVKLARVYGKNVSLHLENINS